MGPPIKMSGVRRTLEHSITAPVNLKSTQSLASKKKKKKSTTEKEKRTIFSLCFPAGLHR